MTNDIIFLYKICQQNQPQWSQYCSKQKMVLSKQMPAYFCNFLQFRNPAFPATKSGLVQDRLFCLVLMLNIHCPDTLYVSLWAFLKIFGMWVCDFCLIHTSGSRSSRTHSSCFSSSSESLLRISSSLMFLYFSNSFRNGTDMASSKLRPAKFPCPPFRNQSSESLLKNEKLSILWIAACSN